MCCLIAGALLVEEDLTGALTSLAWFVVTVCITHVLHAFVLLPLVYGVVMRRNPLPHYGRIADALTAGSAPPSSYVIRMRAYIRSKYAERVGNSLHSNYGARWQKPYQPLKV